MAACNSSVMLVSNLSHNSVNEPDEGVQRFRFPILIEKEGHNTKIKWLGDLEHLKSFVEHELKLSGSWSYTPNNGGFHVYRANMVSLCFYPGTKTLAIKGVKQEVIKKSITEIYFRENRDEIADHVAAEDRQDGGLVNNNNTITEEVADAIPHPNSGEYDDVKNSCSGCERNSKDISELCAKIASIENQFRCCDESHKAESESCNNMKKRIEELEAERENLLTVIKMPSQDQQDIPEEKVGVEEPWKKVENANKNKK